MIRALIQPQTLFPFLLLMALGCTRANEDFFPNPNADAAFGENPTDAGSADSSMTPASEACGDNSADCATVANGENICLNGQCQLSCNDGYLNAEGRCLDVDECLTNNGGCDVNAICENIDGSRNCICSPGFEGDGENCVNIDNCTADLCENGGTCIDGVDTYTCQCVAGFEGINCEINIDDCAANRCANGGTCIDGIDGYTCECAQGFEDPNCETNTNDCDADSCANGGTCIDGVNSYRCICSPGFEGTTCEVNIDDCALNRCLNGGTCSDGVDSYTCQCAVGFEGTNCEINIDDCAVNRCMNGGTCIDGVNGFTCACTAGFDGTNCEINIDDCTVDSCMNGGTCIDDVNGFTCACAAGFDGTNCEINIDDCTVDSCINDGTCIDGVNSYTCQCAAGFEGTNCETNIDDCAAEPCINGGNCVDGVDSYTCQCDAGYAGTNCETNIDDCAAQPCTNGGICIDGINNYTCQCAAGFEGANCEVNIDDCAAQPCTNGGICIDGVDSYTCQCADGFEGTNCETNIDECTANNCPDNSRCIDAVNGFTCECLDGYYGEACTQSQCGDGVARLAEECDDGNLSNDDGCDTDCEVEWGFYCDLDQLPSVCVSICGDGLKATNEGCDYGDVQENDGCDANCEIEIPVTFQCAIANHEAQLNAAPDYEYVQSNGEKALTADLQPWARSWEPILEPVPGCNGEPWRADAVDPGLKVFKFIVVLDKSWVEYYAAQSEHFATQGYPSLAQSAGILFDRTSYLYEIQFGVRLEISRVVVAPELTEKCATNDNYVENEIRDSSNTFVVLEQNGISRQPSEAGILRLGVGSATPGQYCHSAAPLNGICSDNLFTNQRKPFDGDDGILNHRAAVVLAHEMAHYFGYCGNNAHPHCLNAHTANEIPDIMVYNGVPAANVREEGMFFKFFTSCTPLYDETVCSTVKNAPAACGTTLNCENGGLDCDTAYWTARGAITNQDIIPQEVRDRSERMVVRCCRDGDGVDCESNNLGGLVSWFNQRECSGLMTWPEADRFCRQAGRRLCSIDELTVSNVCAGTGCGYDAQRVWTATPKLEPNDFVGTYHRLPLENAWHEVTVTLEDGVLIWRNNAGVSWVLTPQERILITPEDSPYGEQTVLPILSKDERGQQRRRVEALRFLGESYFLQ